MIPLYRRPRRDEHVYGWLMELAAMNGMTVRKFLDCYGGGQQWEGTLDSVKGLYYLEQRPPLVWLLYRCTLLPALFPYMEEARQASAVNHLFYGGRGNVYHTCRNMKVCPECMKRDMRSGIMPYYRVWHQLNEVRTCAVHGSILLSVKKNGPLSEEGVAASAVWEGRGSPQTACRILDMYKAPAGISYEDWRCRLPKGDRIKSREYRISVFKDEWAGSARRELVRDIRCSLCGEPFPGHAYMEGRYSICPACRKELGPEGTEQAILSIRKDYRIEDGHIIHVPCGQEFRQRTLSPAKFLWDGVECGCLKKKGSLRIHKRTFDDDEFTVTGYIRNPDGHRSIRVRHNVCGNEFVIKSHDFKKRRFCRVCGSKAYWFSDKVRAMTNGEYEVLKQPSSIGNGHSSEVVLKHVPCGTIYTNRARNFLEGQRCPFCVTKPGAEEVVRLLRESCDTSRYMLRTDGSYIWVRLPDKKTIRIRCTQALQDLTRYDEPEIFVRNRRIDAPINDKAKLYLFYRERYRDGEPFTTENGPKETGVPESNYFSAMSHLVKKGKLERLSKGVYKVAGNTDDGDPGDVPPV